MAKTEANKKTGSSSTGKRKLSDSAAREIRRMLAEDKNGYMQSMLKKMKTITYVQPGEVPNIDLYMDQVTKFMDEHLESSKRYSDDKLLTKTMINNYTKNDLLPSPEKKKYTKDHMYTLLFIYYLKNVLSIDDTSSVLKPLTDMFFGDNGSIDMEDIYAEIFGIEYEQSYAITRDIIKKYYKSKESFDEVEDKKEQDFLQAFAFIGMLCFDVYMKKLMIGKIIDDNFSLDNLIKPDSEKNEKTSKADKENKPDKSKK
ncbi:MAG: DUF1836 domain-containing protein [Lachnospiraceae bacterium]|nr:DUF1836 domain-containing protein [Lachnospiraceae bacterium]